MAGVTDQGGRAEGEPRTEAPRASTTWSIPEIRIVKDDQGRLRIDQTDPATYGAYTARQFLATAKADPRYRDGMTKRPSTAAIKITYIGSLGERQEIPFREIFCRMDGDALVLTHFENAEGEKVKDLPIAAPSANKADVDEAEDPPVAVSSPDESDDDVDDEDRLHRLALAELGELPSTPSAAELEPEPEPARPAPTRERRLPTGPLRRYDETPNPPPAASMPTTSSPAAPGPRDPAVKPPATNPARATTGPTVKAALRALDEAEAAALRGLIEAKAGETRWASGLLMQAAERYPSDRKQQNEHLAKLLQVSLDPARTEYSTPLAATLRGILEEVHAYKGGVLDRDPQKAEKVALQSFARLALAATPEEGVQIKTVSGTTQRTPAQVLAKLEDPKLARATRVKLLLEVVPELIGSWRPDKESGRSEAGNESSPAIVRRLFTVANEQRQQRKYIDDGPTFRKAGDKYTALEAKLPKASAGDDS